MSAQLRIYAIKPGRLNEFTHFWRTEIVPLRESFGFTVDGAWSDPETDTFAWVVSHADFAVAQADYYASPDRKMLSHDPAEFIDHMDLRLLEPVIDEI
jgi:hypothetical protein